jgi:hypothetical protein
MGVAGEYKAASMAEIFASFEPGHVYRITANYEDEVISVVLWDETNGAQARTRVADWSFNCPSETKSASPEVQYLREKR